MTKMSLAMLVSVIPSSCNLLIVSLTPPDILLSQSIILVPSLGMLLAIDVRALEIALNTSDPTKPLYSRNISIDSERLGIFIFAF